MTLSGQSFPSGASTPATRSESQAASGPLPPVAELPSLREVRRDFPLFAIWPELIGERVRYIARRARPGIHPHTVVTADLAEMRAVLIHAATQQGPGGGRFLAGVGIKQTSAVSGSS